MTTTHARIQELIAVYVLDAVDDDERRAAEPELIDHLADCETCRVLYRDLRETAGDLALAAPATPVPAGLQARLMDAIQESAPPGPPAVARPSRWRLAAVAVAATVTALSVWNLQLASRVRDLDARQRTATAAMQVLTDPRATHRVLSASAGTGGEVSVALARDGRAVLVGAGLPALGSGEVFHLWLIRDGAPVPSVTFAPADGAAIVAFAGVDPSRDSAMAITIERGRVRAPTREPIYQGTLV